MIDVKFQSTSIQLEVVTSITELKATISRSFGLKEDDFFLLCNGKRLQNDYVPNSIIHVVPRTLGGKGGFGSMLRAIGAQIEKTTNREACRDLSGRRLRDINEEKRLKTWLAQKEEREREAEKKRIQKLERLCQEPKIELKDEAFLKQRLELTENISNSVEQGLKAGCSSSTKRKSETDPKPTKKLKGLLDDFDEDTDEDSSGSEAENAEIEEMKECEAGLSIVKA